MRRLVARQINGRRLSYAIALWYRSLDRRSDAGAIGMRRWNPHLHPSIGFDRFENIFILILYDASRSFSFSYFIVAMDVSGYPTHRLRRCLAREIKPIAVFDRADVFDESTDAFHSPDGFQLLLSTESECSMRRPMFRWRRCLDREIKPIAVFDRARVFDASTDVSIVRSFAYSMTAGNGVDKAMCSAPRTGRRCAAT